MSGRANSGDSPPSLGQEEKGNPSKESVTAVQDTAVVPHSDTAFANSYDDEDFWTRNGLNAKSFQKKHYGLGLVELDRAMKTRHVQMIAIGGSIGAGFFVGSGGALSKGGPASVLICFLLVGFMVFNVVFALGELAIMYPVSGGFYTYATRFIDPSFGFAVGWNYFFLWFVVLPLELTVCSLVIQYWNQDISVGVWITIFWAAIVLINVFGSIGYAEEEFWSSVIKLAATVVFMIISFVLVLGGGPSSGRYSEYVGTHYWHDPGAFRNGFRGFCSVFVTAAFSFTGTELVGLAAAESRNPVKSLPSSIKQVFWRITLFYVLGLFFVGLLVPSDDPRLLSSAAYTDVKASPFVLIGLYAGLGGFDHFMNAVILVSVVSIGVSSVYGGSRTLTAMAQQGYAPKLFTYIDRSGRCLPSTVVMLLTGPLAYINLSASGPTVFNWLQALSGLAVLFAWAAICLAHIRFRAAWLYHGHSLDEIPFKAVFGVAGSWMGLFICFIVFAAQFFTAIAPPGKTGINDVEGFFQSYLAFPIVVAFWICGYVWKRTGWLKVAQIDVDTGRRELDWDEIRAYREHVASLPSWKRVYYHLFQ
ncbi:amino-acid permease inda1 [Trichoderma cornu-damae]|uniref:Amino-acid permease inda1 n=1 Tax=Trichoderma cornu-damae TaxID=654480 RepID=A0A9P8QNC6_9HYPO|nr:amino-acid permease inda1 [Trichoderma cornu-damae]